MIVDPLGADARPDTTPGWTRLVVAFALVVGVALLAQAALASSATYDEVAYMRIASDWWRRGETSELTRIGSPITFYKLQHAPVFFALDALGYRNLVDDPLANQSRLLPIVRLASMWIWLAAFALTVAWSRCLYGPRAMALAACLFALSPNLIAHGSLATMEMPLIAATAGTFFFFWRFLDSGSRRGLVLSAAFAGLAFACKFTAVLYPPILAIVWAVDRWRAGERGVGRVFGTVALGMVGYVATLLAVDLLVTGFATIKASPRSGNHPSVPDAIGWVLDQKWPQDWVGMVNQVLQQRGGGPSYLLGEQRMTGWWYYYPIALAVKVPLGVLLLLVARSFLSFVLPTTRRDWLLPLALTLFLAVAMVGSKRNYGVRYVLPMAPLAVVWVSGLAGASRAVRAIPHPTLPREGGGIYCDPIKKTELNDSGTMCRILIAIGLVGLGVELVACHPFELSFFNQFAGGTIGGRRILADSNLDWGQGVRSFAAIEDRYQPLTLFYFGEADPRHYGVRSAVRIVTANDLSAVPLYRPMIGMEDVCEDVRTLPLRRWAPTRFVAVSASLQHGPWGPPDYFRPLRGLQPIAYTADGTIAIYDVEAAPATQ